MADREEYRQCMVPWMKGSGSQGERRSRMCIGAKICSGKAGSREEAEVICSQPKPEKVKQVRKGKKQLLEKREASCEAEVLRLASCVADRANMDLVGNVNSLEIGIANALHECMCGAGE